MISRLSNIFYSGIDENTSENDIRKYILLNILLLITSFLLFLFTFSNFLIGIHYNLLIINFIAFVLNIYAFYDLRIHHRLHRASLIGTINAFCLLLAVIYFAKAENFTLVWVVFFPVFAIFINGCKKGLRIAILFYIIAFYLAYQGIGEWLNGLWNSASFVRFVAANIGMLFITYLFEKSFEAAHQELIQNRNLEQKYIAELEKVSITDPLTQLYNRRHLDHLFYKQYRKAKEYHSYFALFILDLDNFKAYNDTYGHLAGDEALKQVAATLKSSMRRGTDTVFRLGGEEFAGLLMADSKERIEKSVDQIRKNIEALQIEHKKTSYGVLTASIGVCIIKDFEKPDFDKMYKIADDALYKAKAKGRNRIEVIEVSTL